MRCFLVRFVEIIAAMETTSTTGPDSLCPGVFVNSQLTGTERMWSYLPKYAI